MFSLNPANGAFIGALSFLIVDLLFGYPHYIFASVLVKAAVGFTAGMLHRHIMRNAFINSIQALIVAAAFTLSGVLIYSGQSYLGYVEKLYLGEAVMAHGGVHAYPINIPYWLWVIGGLAITLCLKFASTPRWTGFGIILGAIAASSAYFLYELAVLPNFKVYVNAWANAPLNFGKTVIEGSIAVLAMKIAQLLKSTVLSQSKG